ncbi:MAG TPA: glycosyltransferase 87 family protein [Methanomassiliicoccales archaeon]|nr:glycosyltransferase 87 family protein [Methanomassiliicoccales archaeon]
MRLRLLDRWGMVTEKLRPLTTGRKLVLYAMLVLILYGSMIIVDNTFLVNVIDEDLSHPDLDVYRERAQTILDGNLLYRDVHTETPPFINYLLVVPQLLGGAEHDWVWSIYFSLFAFLLASLIYLSLRQYDELKAYLAGGVVLLSPFTLVESGTGEDESIVAFIFILAVVLMLLQRRNQASVAIGVGIWTKMFPVLLFPVHFLQQRNWKDRFQTIIIALLVTGIIALPFVLLCWEDFSYFLNFYFLGDGGRPTGGSSFWHFLNMGGWGIPSVVQLALLGVAMAFAYLYPYHMRMSVWQSVIIVMMVFFIFYPKVHMGYWIMMVALLSIWAAQNWKIWARLFFAYLPMILATMLARGEGTEPPVEFNGSWLVGLALALIGLLLFVDAVRLALKERPFIDNKALESGD